MLRDTYIKISSSKTASTSEICFQSLQRCCCESSPKHASLSMPHEASQSLALACRLCDSSAGRTPLIKRHFCRTGIAASVTIAVSSKPVQSVANTRPSASNDTGPVRMSTPQSTQTHTHAEDALPSCSPVQLSSLQRLALLPGWHYCRFSIAGCLTMSLVWHCRLRGISANDSMHQHAHFSGPRLHVCRKRDTFF